MLGCTLLAVVMALPAAAATTTVVVGGNTAAAENEPGWMFNRDTTTSTPYEFTNAKASIGAGSVYIEPIGGEVIATSKGMFYLEGIILKSSNRR
mgnify:CR=1 FL=1